MTRCEQFYAKVEAMQCDIPKVEKWCKKEYSTATRIVAHLKFCEEHHLPIGNISEYATRAIRSLTKYAPQLVPVIVEEIRQCKNPTTMDVYNMIHKKLREQIPPLSRPDGEYDVVVVDPPWPGPQRCAGIYEPEYGRAGPPYAAMSVEEIANLKLPLANNAAVFLWTFNPYLHASFHILESWKLEWKNLLIWVKDSIKIGTLFRSQHELVQVAFKGHPDFRFTQQPTVFHGTTHRHSQKPDAFYDLVAAMFPGRRLDMFARQQREGWDVWGAEVGKLG